MTLVDIDADGAVSWEKLALTPRSELRLVEGFLEDVLEAGEKDGSPGDYLLARLLDEGAILDAMGQLRSVYPNTLHIERPGLQLQAGEMAGARDHRQRSELNLFRDFYRQLREQELSPEQEAVVSQVIHDLRHAGERGPE